MVGNALPVNDFLIKEKDGQKMRKVIAKGMNKKMQ